MNWARETTLLPLNSVVKVDDEVHKSAAAFDYDSNGVTTFDGSPRPRYGGLRCTNIALMLVGFSRGP